MIAYLFGLFLSAATGFLLIERLLGRHHLPRLLHIFLSIGTGLGASGALGFFSLMIFNRYVPAAVLILHFLLIAILGFFSYTSLLTKRKFWLEKPRSTDWLEFAALAAIAIAIFVVGHLYPFGGWDAWSCWNLKARFIFLGGENWEAMMDPILWRSNIQYPFLLPLIHCWFWGLQGAPNQLFPLYTAAIISIATVGLLFAGIKYTTESRWAMIPVLFWASLPFTMKLFTSQYSDILIAYYILAAAIGITLALRSKNSAWLPIVVLNLGFLSFTKTEGTVAAGLLTLGLIFFLLRRVWTLQKSGWLRLTVAGLFAFLPLLIFKLAFETENVTFINGLTSSDKPLNAVRLQVIGIFFLVEMISLKWNGLWIIVLASACIAWRRVLEPTLRFIPVFLLCYIGVACAYYAINTYFEIAWWLGTTLNRILFAIVPVILFCVFSAFLGEKKM